MALASLAQQVFSSGFWRSVARHLIPADGAYDLVNALLDEDGSPYKRGGPAYLSTSAFGTSLRFLWDGFLGPGRRTVVANTADFGVLDGAEGPVNLGGAGLSSPARAVELAGILFIGGGAMYAGSRKTAAYSTGTVTVTNGSKTVTGSGTTWNTLVDAGMLFGLSGAGLVQYPVASIDSTTQITLRDAYAGPTASGQAYALSPLVSGAYVATVLAVAGKRLWAFAGGRGAFSARDNPRSFAATDFHQLPEGAETIGAAGVGDRLLWFSTNGLWVVSGVTLDLTDDYGNPQHRLEHVNPDLILLSHEGIATYKGAVVAPCADGVWLVDGVGSPELLTRSIAPFWRRYVELGYKTGLPAVFRSHYFLPILDGSNAVVDCLVCRLDRPTKSPVGTVFPWTRLKGYGGEMAAFGVRTGGAASSRSPRLLGASTRSSARVADCTPFFGPDVPFGLEPDGSEIEFTVDTRDYPTGSGHNVNTVRRMRTRYELLDADDDDPTIAGFYSVGVFDGTGLPVWDVDDWDGAEWAEDDAGEWLALEGLAPEDDGRTPYTWHVNKRARFIRFRLRSTEAAARLAVRSVELFVRLSGKA